jgi:hypothetical protein
MADLTAPARLRAAAGLPGSGGTPDFPLGLGH